MKLTPSEMQSISFRSAIASDAEAVCALVNSAYRGESSRHGWTTEADFLDGQRIDREMLLELIRQPEVRIELAFLPDGSLAGCVELKRELPQCCYLGMLTIDPARQRGGLGHRLLEHCEALALQWGCASMRMRVIEGRNELIRYYERRGYRLTGDYEPFPNHDVRFGIPKLPGLRFVVLTKDLREEAGRISVHRLSAATEADFFRMREHESCNWCFCVAWHVPTWDGWTKRSAAENRAAREQLFKESKYDGYLLYAEDKPVGWCQCAPLDWSPKLIGQMDLGNESAGTFVIGCLEILPEHRKQGLSRILLREVLADLRRLGVARVVAIPRTGRHEDGKVWTGPAVLFESLGFRPLKTVGDRQVMVLELASP